MAAAPLPPFEDQRLAALYRCQILDTLPEPAFDDLVQLAVQLTQVPIALISLVDRDRQWFKAHYGLAVAETPRKVSFCAHAILQPEQLLVVPDALADDRFRDNPLVQGEPFIRFYLGAPLRAATGEALGTLCLIDQIPRQLSAAQIQGVLALARQVESQLSLRLMLKQQQTTAAALQASEARYRGVVEDQTEWICRFQANGELTFVSESYGRYLGRSAAELVGQNFFELVPPAVFVPEADSSQGAGPMAPPQTGGYLLDACSLVAHQQDLSVADWAQTKDLGAMGAEVTHYEHCRLSDTGEICWELWTERTLRDAAGEILEFQAVGRAITALKQARLAAQRQVEREQLIGAIARRVRDSLHLPEILQTTVSEVQKFLQADRVLLCQQVGKTGQILTEAASGGCPSVVGERLPTSL